MAQNAKSRRKIRRPPMECKLWTTREVADLLGLTVWTLVSWRQRRRRTGKHLGTERGPAYLKLGGAVRYRPADINSWLRARRRVA